MHTKFGLALTLIALIAAHHGNVVTAGVIFWTDEAQWQQVVSGAVGLDFTSANVALAAEVLAPPGSNEPLGSVLTFNSGSTGFDSTVAARAMESGAGFVFDDSSNNFVDAISVGEINRYEDDDVQFSFSGAPVYGFGMDLRDNSTSSSEHFYVYGPGDALLGSSWNVPGGGSRFIGAISSFPIERVLLDEDSGGDDVAVGGFQFTNTFVPFACEHDGIYFANCVTAFADQVLRYDPLYSGGPAPTQADNLDPAAALGPPDYDAGGREVSLGRGGLIELLFADNNLTNSGDSQLDVHVFEVGPDVEDTFVAIRPTAATLPLLDPSADANGDGYFEVGKVFGSTDSLDIDAVFPGFASGSLRFDAVQLIDDYNEGASSGPAVGADIDAVGAIASGLPSCDFDQDADCDIEDLNLQLLEGPVADDVTVVPGVNDQFDLNGDGVINNADVDLWLSDAAAANGFASAYFRGDANLDGFVDVLDFNNWNSHKFTLSLLWHFGDFNGDGLVDVSDFNAWNGNKFSASDAVRSVPEPATALMMLLAFVLAWAAVTHAEDFAGPRSGERGYGEVIS